LWAHPLNSADLLREPPRDFLGGGLLHGDTAILAAPDVRLIDWRRERDIDFSRSSTDLVPGIT
jgi:hypothetical protein